MGKLLQKLVNGIVPSWLTKVKSSAEASPKKLLPYFKGRTHVSSSSSSSPSSSTKQNTDVPPPVSYDNTDQSIEDEEQPDSKACAESPVVKANPALAKQGKTASMKQKAHKNNETQDSHHQDHKDTHHPHHVDVKTHNNQGMQEHGANSCTPPGTPSSRKQGTTSIHKDEHDHHPQQHQRNCKNQPGLEKRNQRTPEADNHHHQEVRSGRHNVNHMELGSFFELERGDTVCVQEDNRHNHRDKEHSHEAEIENGHYTKLYHDLLGLKRKSQYLQEEEEEELEEEEEGGSYGSGNIDMTGWGWKRRKGERGIMSCELPESICCIVGNGKAVVKHSQDPHMALWESMVEMIVGNGLWELGSLEFLLFCYLSLNEPHLHPLIQSSFLQVLKDLEKT